MGFYQQSFVIVEGLDAETVSNRVTELLNDGYDLYGELNVTAVVPHDHPAHVVYSQAVVKRGERSYG